MYFKRSIALLLMLAGYSTGIAQTFTGRVLDKGTKEPVPFVTVYFIELETGTTGDATGVFRIEHSPTDKVRVQITSVGYTTINEELNLAEVARKDFFMEQSHVDLEEIVVSTHAGRLASENVVSIERRKLSQLQAYAPTTLAEAIAEIPGVEQVSTGTGIGKPMIRGLTGNRIVVFSQGIRVENQQWGGEHGLGVGEAGIEGVEVIKGPASLLYGSDAIGGVLYFVSERYTEHNTVKGYVSTRMMSNSIGSNTSAGMKIHKERLKVNAFGTYLSNADYQIPGGDRVSNTRFDEKNFKLAVGYDLTNWISNIRYSFLKNDYGIPGDSLSTTTERKPVMPYQTIDDHSVSWENTFFTKHAKVKMIGGYMGNRRKEFEDVSSSPALDMELETYTYDAKWYSPAISEQYELIAGVQGMHQTNLNRGAEALIPDGTVDDVGLFTTFNFNNDRFSLQSGLRADQRQIHTLKLLQGKDTIRAFEGKFSSINYAIGGVLKSNMLTTRANISSGFRAPNTSELLSHGVHEGANRYEIGSRELKSENATQVDFTLDYQSEHLSFQLNPFYNLVHNYIFLSPQDSIAGGAPVFEYQQKDAFLYGGEAGVHYHPHSIHWLHLESNISTVLAEDKQGAPLPLMPATRVSSTAKVEIDQEGRVRLKECFVQHKYVFKQNRISQLETETGEYQLLNMGVVFEIQKGATPVEFSVGINNLLNTDYIDHLSRLKNMDIPNQGINVYASLKVPFTKQIGEAELH